MQSFSRLAGHYIWENKIGRYEVSISGVSESGQVHGLGMAIVNAFRGHIPRSRLREPMRRVAPLPRPDSSPHAHGTDMRALSTRPVIRVPLEPSPSQDLRSQGSLCRRRGRTWCLRYVYREEGVGRYWCPGLPVASTPSRKPPSRLRAKLRGIHAACLTRVAGSNPILWGWQANFGRSP